MILQAALLIELTGSWMSVQANVETDRAAGNAPETHFLRLSQ